MPVDISSLAYSLRKSSATAGPELKHGHAQQLFAAALGYNSLAAYQAAVAAKAERPKFDAAAHVLLDEDLVEQRAAELELPHDAEALNELIRKVLDEVLPGTDVHRWESSFQDAICERLQEFVESSGPVSSAMGDANHGGVSETYMPFEFAWSELPPAGEVHVEEVKGQVTLELDIERPYSGHEIAVIATVTLERLGRNIVGQPEFDVQSASLSRDY
jgi:hypothetical protein